MTKITQDSISYSKSSSRNPTHQSFFPTVSRSHPQFSPNIFSFDFLKFPLTKLFNIQKLLHHTSKMLPRLFKVEH